MNRAFRIGLLAGAFTAAAVLGGAALTLTALQAPYNIEVLANGADVTRLGGRRLQVENPHGVAFLTVACNGACDDVGYRLRKGAETSARVMALNAAGGCVVCGQYVYVDGAFTAQWRVAGREQLTVASRYVEAQANPLRAPSFP